MCRISNEAHTVFVPCRHHNLSHTIVENKIVFRQRFKKMHEVLIVFAIMLNHVGPSIFWRKRHKLIGHTILIAWIMLERSTKCSLQTGHHESFEYFFHVFGRICQLVIEPPLK